MFQKVCLSDSLTNNVSDSSVVSLYMKSFAIRKLLKFITIYMDRKWNILNNNIFLKQLLCILSLKLEIKLDLENKVEASGFN